MEDRGDGVLVLPFCHGFHVYTLLFLFSVTLLSEAFPAETNPKLVCKHQIAFNQI